MSNVRLFILHRISEEDKSAKFKFEASGLQIQTRVGFLGFGREFRTKPSQTSFVSNIREYLEHLYDTTRRALRSIPISEITPEYVHEDRRDSAKSQEPDSRSSFEVNSSK